MNTARQQLETLFGKFIVIDVECPVCSDKLPYTEVQPYFLDGLTIYCENCDSPIKASSLTQHAPDRRGRSDEDEGSESGGG